MYCECPEPKPSKDPANHLCKTCGYALKRPPSAPPAPPPAMRDWKDQRVIALAEKLLPSWTAHVIQDGLNEDAAVHGSFEMAEAFFKEVDRRANTKI